MGSRLEANSNRVRKRIENHEFENEEGEEYQGSEFGGFADYFRRKKIKLQNLDVELRASSPEKPPIFRGIVAHVNGYTQPSLNDIHVLIVTHGGGFSQYLDGKTTVTHIIASSLTPKKAVEFRRYRIVKPAWVVDSVNAGRLLPWENYRVLDEGPRQKTLGFDNGKVVSQTKSQREGYRDQTDASWYTKQLIRPIDDEIDEYNQPLPNTQSLRTASQSGTLDLVSSSQAQRIKESSKSVPSFETSSSRLVREVSLPSANTPRFTQERHHSHPPTADPDPIQDDFELLADAAAISFGDESQKDKQLPSVEPLDFEEDNLASPEESPSGIGTDRARDQASPSSVKRPAKTAEEHNALLLADPRVRKSTVVNPDFLKQYYSESRLHHLSSWKADLKSQLQALTAETSATQRALQKHNPRARRYILHVDFDSFFVAVSMKNSPQYMEKPAVVAHGGGPGSEIASCNYPARKFGIKNGMWMKQAQNLCPELKVLPYDFKGYEEASRNFYDAILATGGIVQSVSVDEALVDVSSLCIAAGGSEGTGVREGSIWREQAKADEIAQGIRDRVKDLTSCAVSVGIGGNILLAKLALRKAKPAGQYQVKPEDVLDFIGPLEVQDLPGVSYSIGGKLEEIGVKFVKDIREVSKERLISALGPKTGEKIWEYARGIDRIEVGDQVVRKSVSAEVNWGVRFETQAQAEEFIHNLSEELHRRLEVQRVKGRQLTMKVMRRAADAPLDPPKHLGHGKCDTFNKSILLGVATNAIDILSKESISILRGFNVSPGELRGIGLQMTRLEPLKVTGEGQPSSSQKLLSFKRPVQPNSSAAQPAEQADDPISDYGESPHKAQKFRSPGSIIGPKSGAPQDESAKPLNMLGTQFILPSQVDPRVLAELPADIRSKLFPTNLSMDKTTDEAPPAPSSPRSKHTPQPTSRATTPVTGNIRPSSSRSASPAVPPLPNPFQLDPEALDALPEDVRAEVLDFYTTTHPQTTLSPSRRHDGITQSLLPQSPRKSRPFAPLTSKKQTTPTKKRTTSKLTSNLSAAASFNPTLTQSNFVATTRQSATTTADNPAATATDSEPIAPDFLAALPPDIRAELLAEQRRKHLLARSHLQLPNPFGTRTRGSRGKRGSSLAAAASGGFLSRAGLGAGGTVTTRRQQQQQQQQNQPRQLHLPPRPPKPTFTTRRLTALPDLRDAVSAWYAEFADEPPYEEDVAALVKYLKRVVTEERDMHKAVAVADWLAWILHDAKGDCVVVDDGAGQGGGGRSERRGGDDDRGEDTKGAEKVSPFQAWRRALQSVRAGVQEAVVSRGLGKVSFRFG
ncbi:DNA repair protein [Xylona heveae TC161]|uniref:DNA repair protein REV1 n=1 Tax=Xylona heveae (strain CBS 132557 / TC161) TaxID=1328760 RepID=A0A165GMM2_XYLHT|nr:DNA repair protein [Xylona heveae TC161]KZF22377.1 DNA repair protein [Xylona heveae TC161]